MYLISTKQFKRKRREQKRQLATLSRIVETYERYAFLTLLSVNWKALVKRFKLW